MRARLAGDAHALLLRAADQINALRRRDVQDVQPAAGQLRHGYLAIDADLLRRAGVAGDAAGAGRGGAGLDGLVLLASRFAQVNVHVDQAGTDDAVLRVDGRIGDSGLRSDAEDVAIADPELSDLIEVLRRIDDPSAANAD